MSTIIRVFIVLVCAEKSVHRLTRPSFTFLTSPGSKNSYYGACFDSFIKMSLENEVGPLSRFR